VTPTGTCWWRSAYKLRQSAESPRSVKRSDENRVTWSKHCLHYSYASVHSGLNTVTVRVIDGCDRLQVVAGR